MTRCGRVLVAVAIAGASLIGFDETLVTARLQVRPSESPAAGLAQGSPENTGLVPQRLDAVTALLRQAVADQKIAGAVAGVARHGKVGYLAPVGVQDLTTGVPMTARTMFRIYSMTKPVTAVAVMMLHEQGHFQLTDPVAKYLPEFDRVAVRTADGTTRPPSRPMTIEDLLLHTSGLNHRTSPEYQQARVRARDITLPQFISNIVRVPLAEDPGTRFRYSEATTVLGRLVEIWSGEAFDQFLRARVLAPLRMADTTFAVTDAERERLATVYAPRAGGGLSAIEIETVPFTVRPALSEGAVGLVSTVPDFLRFAQMLLNGGELDGVRLLGRETVDRMTANGLSTSLLASRRGGLVGWGLGNVEVVVEPSGLPYPATRGEYGWDGSAGTIFWVDRSKEMITVLMTQSSPADPGRLRPQFKTLVEQAVVR